ncbi:hypothetical protein BTA51_16970 [Hahella sp. CCB-MM4]|uniref:hybrid sensor histidine kinase/response regulator n=1 Tax=Hahella sp. (strain CCB-MM4) TaxID=1926491 RepID=UPI000B9C3600|nr:response regulator [Hahella sp. CCB-MM4]OZG72064.1 hypothetical protein BTA51_16970 [Hahella sp. CCB-MM4]
MDAHDQNMAMTSLADVFRDDLNQIVQSEIPTADDLFALMDNIAAMLDMVECPQLLARVDRLRSQLVPNGETSDSAQEPLPKSKIVSVAQWMLRLLESLNDPLVFAPPTISTSDDSDAGESEAALPEDQAKDSSELSRSDTVATLPDTDDSPSDVSDFQPDENKALETCEMEELYKVEEEEEPEEIEASDETDTISLCEAHEISMDESTDLDWDADQEKEFVDSDSEVPMLDLTEIPADSNLSPEQAELVEAFWSEICELEADLNEALDVMAASESNRSPYVGLLQTLAETSSYLGIIGLQHFFDCLSIRLQSEDTVGKSQIQHLYKWPSLVKDYLYEQASENSCLALLEYLEAPCWTQPIDSEDQQALLFALVEFEVSSEALDDTPSQVYTEEDVALNISSDVTLEVKHAFLQDAPIHTHAIFEALANLGDAEAPDKQWVIKAQRASHSLKGSANLLGIKGVANISHTLEDIFEVMAKGETSVPDQLYEILMEASDCLSSMVDFLAGKDQPPENAFEVLEQLVHWNRPDSRFSVAEPDFMEEPEFSDLSQEPRVSALSQTSSASSQTETKQEFDSSEDSPEAPQRDAAPGTNIEPPLSDFDNLVLLAEEMSINNVQGKELYKRIHSTAEDLSRHDQLLSQRRLQLEGLIDNRSMDRRPSRQVPQQPNQTAKGQPTPKVDENNAEFDPLEMDRYDELHECSHQLFESVADVRELNHKLQDQLLMLDSLMRQQHRYIDKLQHQLLSKQKLSASELTGRLQRCVRQACRAAGKSAALNVIGDDLEVDRILIEQLADPLMHLLRNAVDHGIENTVIREQAGKNSRGNIMVQYSQVGRFLQVVLEDDGGGLDYDSIFRKALKAGIIAEGSSRPTDQELAQIVWQPGFTTRDKATQLSGRGIGMDAVRSQVESLGGSIRFDTEAKTDNTPGCRLVIRVPVREITQYMLLVTVCKQRFAIPSSTLTQIMATGAGELEEIAGQTYLSANDELFRYVDLAKSLFGIDEESKSKPLIVADVSGVLTAIAVDEIKTGDQLVLRTPGRLIPTLPGLFGMTILGDGTLVPVLNLVELLQTGNKSNQSTAPISASQEILNKVMVVDDSLSVRQTLKQLLQDCGFTVTTACDGLEAIEKIKAEAPQLLLVDMEMPRMDGLELTRQLRQTPEHNQLPILMLTSRSQHKHRELAKKAGVNGYATKPYNENDLMDKIQELLG